MFYNHKYNCYFENTIPNSNICFFLIIDNKYERLIIADKDKFINSINNFNVSNPINFLDLLQRYEYNNYGIYAIEKNSLGKLLRDFIELSQQTIIINKDESKLTDKIFTLYNLLNQFTIVPEDIQIQMKFFCHTPNILIKYKWLLLTNILSNNSNNLYSDNFISAFKYLSCLYNDLSIVLHDCLLDSLKYDKKYDCISFYHFINNGYIEPLILKYSNACEIMYSKNDWPVKYLTSKADIITLLLYYVEQLTIAGYCIKQCRNCKSIIVCHKDETFRFCSINCYREYNRKSKKKHDKKIKNNKNEKAYKNFDQYLRRLENKLKANNVSTDLLNSFHNDIFQMRNQAKSQKQKITKGVISNNGYLGQLEVNKNKALEIFSNVLNLNNIQRKD